MADRFLGIIAGVVAQMKGAGAFSAPMVCERLLAQLVEQFEADAAFLRHNDHSLRASMLIAEWPPRDVVPDLDPLAEIPFADADGVVAEELKTPTVIASDTAKLGHASRFADCRGRAWVTAVAPLVWETVTTGVLGLTRWGGDGWTPEELDVLAVVASLFAQLQSRIAAESRLHRLAEQDELTGLHNRRALTAEIRRRLQMGQPGPVAALYIDLDRLKTINDHLGHAAGDMVIRACAQRLGAKVGHDALVARVGGDEFVVIPKGTMSAESAGDLARTLHTTMCDPVRIGADLVTRTLSIGVAVGIPGVDAGDDLLHRADQAALAVKRKGGNAVAVFNHGVPMLCASRNGSALHSPAGIDSDALVLQYLPEIDLRTGEILAVEALACWEQPTRGLVPVDAQNGAPQSISLAGRLGRWVMRRACGDFSRWRSDGIDQQITLRVNVSSALLASDGFADSVAATTDEFGIDAGSLCLEICERAMVRDIENTDTTLAMLKHVGVQIAIDDFGSGDVVFRQLKSLPVDMLKIGAGFIRELGTSAVDLAVVQASIGLADAAGLQLTAEGVETPIAAMTLLQHGCSRAQGSLLSGPVTGDAMGPLLSARQIPLPFNATIDLLAPEMRTPRPNTLPQNLSQPYTSLTSEPAAS
ncbi:MAG TPA: EAL domain-containing protein [Mycobacterium sp.]|nr:EAL domain-containing protein [Mycobacterium sp.]